MASLKIYLKNERKISVWLKSVFSEQIRTNERLDGNRATAIGRQQKSLHQGWKGNNSDARETTWETVVPTNTICL